MGLLVNGEWVDQWYKSSAKGEFVRQDSQFRHWVTADGAPGPTGGGGFKAEAGRYHLYISLACPWAHRTLIFLQLKGLQDLISVSIVEPLMLDKGWYFDAGRGDGLYGFEYLHQIYTKAQSDITTRVTVPVLWDKQLNTIVSNESADIIRMFNVAFNELTGNQVDYYPAELRDDIDDFNERIYHTINNGVYRAGFATTQLAYEEAYYALFAELDSLEELLAGRRYLTGNTITEADWRLFTTLLRFDAVYFGHFKTNRQRIADYTNLSEYVRDLYQQPGIAETVDMPYIKKHYYGSHSTINPTAIVPVGQELDFTLPHRRDRFGQQSSAA